MDIDSGGVRIHIEVHGPDDGQPVLLLHGFPDRNCSGAFPMNGFVMRGWGLSRDCG
jgi:pimeloyl-ACP methyl ester carboxylesterase